MARMPAPDDASESFTATFLTSTSPAFAFTAIGQRVPSVVEASVTGFPGSPLKISVLPSGMVSLSAAAVPKRIVLPALVQMSDSTVMSDPPVTVASSAPTNSIAPPSSVSTLPFDATEIPLVTFMVSPETMRSLPRFLTTTRPKAFVASAMMKLSGVM